MIRRILKKVNKAGALLNKFKTAVRPDYLKYLQLELDDKLVLLEGGQGSNINGNMFSMLREINTNPEWQDYKTVFVVTEDTAASAEKRMKKYGFDRVILTVRDSKEYCRYLATAKYIMTDNSFPPYFNKRSEQVFLNTWHGTPLKTLGKSDKSFNGSMANIQKNYLMSDYALFPNEFTRRVFMDDYDLRHIFANKSLIANYPRNYIFYSPEAGVKMKKKLGLDGKSVFAYMPTWRGTGRKANTAKQISSTMKILKEFDKKLSDDQVLLVNLHFLLASNIDCSKFRHIKCFDTSYDTYEVLNACDGLVTDYSSVFFDFAVTGRKIILFAYDKKEYFKTRGVYIPFDELPFPITENVSDTVAEMEKDTADYTEFQNEYCPNGSYSQCGDLFRMMVDAKTDKFTLEKNESDRKLCLIYAGKFRPLHFDNIRNYIDENPDYECVVAYSKNLNDSKKEFINSLRGKASFYGIVTAFQFGYSDILPLIKFRYLHKIKSARALDRFFESEANRRFHSLKPAKVVDFSCGDPIIAGALSKLSGEKEFVVHGDYYLNSKKYANTVSFVKRFEKSCGFNEVDNAEKETKVYLEANSENPIAHCSFRKHSAFKNIIPIYLSSSKALKCISLVSFKAYMPVAMKDTWLVIGNEEYTYKFIGNKNKISKKHVGILSFSVPVEKILDMPSNNKVMLCYNNKYSKTVQCHASYLAALGRIFLGLRSSMLREKETNTIAIFRQTTGNNLNIYVRSFITSDKVIERFKQMAAYFAALLWHGKKAKKLVLLFEKNSSKYEESASVLFEKLIDTGYKDAYFIVDRNYQYFDSIPKKYLPNILYKNSFKHYLYFFKAKTFIGTEMLVHAIDLKTFNVFALKKVADKNINYVFLQHGVMYMVSLDSESRTFFKRKELNGKYRVVVSSRAEADHFVELGRHEYEDLYISGLPKFDRNVMNDDADKIIIMPTWRPWEINMARDDFLQTSYFKMIMRIYDCVPEELRSKVIILPHPLIVNELKKLPKAVSDTIVTNAKYDDVLKQARVLITDYSSIAYDAFYRGTRVIFYWEEKDECLANYGPTTKLMLNEANVYGDYFYSTDGLRESIEYNYYNPQSSEYKDKYSKIVTYHDGHNTDRLIKFLKNDKII